jgi:hypothetical protein
MLRFTPGKNADADEIDSLMTPPFKGDNWFPVETPTTTTGSEDQDLSFTEVNIL